LERRTPVTLDPGLELDPALSPDGKLVAYVAGTPGQTRLLVRQVDGGAPVAVVSEPGGQRFPFWTPDVKRILFQAARGIEIVPAEAGAPIRVTDEQSLNVSPAWAPGALGLLYISTRDGGPDVYQVALTGSGRPRGSPVRLTTGLGARGISVAADGTRLAYAVFAERSNVWSLPLSALGAGAVSIARAVPLTLGNQTIETVALSPDGAWLAFDSDRSGVQQIYRVRLPGGEPEQVTSEPAGALFPSWSPDGRGLSS